jgi:hypothetical protein
MGYSTTASGTFSTATGNSTTASGISSTATGYNTTASGNYSTATGNSTTASGNYSTALGQGTTAQAHVSVALGQFNVPEGDSAIWVGTDPLLVVGNGDVNTPHNALALNKNGDLEIAGAYSSSSDARLKTDIHNLSQPLQKIARLRGVTFKWDAAANAGSVDATRTQIGFLAQEVQAVLPELVKADSKGYLSVNYSGVVPVLVEAVKSLKKENSRLRSELQSQLQANQTANNAAITDLQVELAKLKTLLGTK